MNENNELMSLHNVENIAEAIFNGEIIKTTNFVPASVPNNNFIANNNSTHQFIISMPAQTAMVLSESYLFVELKVTAIPSTTAPTATIETYIRPNIITSMLTNLTINTPKFSYSAINYSNGAALNVLSNILRLRSYTPNQMALISDRENMTWSGNEALNFYEDLNRGFCIFNANIATKTTKIYNVQLPVDVLLPIVNKVKLITGNINLLYQFDYKANMVTNGTYHRTVTPTPNLAIVTGFEFTKIYLFYTSLRFKTELPSLDVQYLSSLDIQRQQLNLNTANFAAGNDLTSVTSMVSPPITISGGKALTIIVIPQIDSITSVAGVNGLTFNANECDRSILRTFPIDNRQGMNSNFILNPLFSISNFRCVSSSGMIFPSNQIPQLRDYIDSSSWNFQNAFVQTLSNAPDGSGSNSCLPFTVYKNLFQALVIDVSNDSTASINQSSTFNISFDIVLNQNVQSDNAYTYTFSGNVFSIAQKQIGN